MNKRRKQPTYSLTDHICRKPNCGGRILQQVTPSTVTGGGNPIFVCSGCGAKSSGMDPAGLCWCGFGFKGQDAAGYSCERVDSIEQKPWMRGAFAQCGFRVDETCQEIGVVHRDGIIDAQRRWEERL